jgi:hypothetical protein
MPLLNDQLLITKDTREIAVQLADRLRHCRTAANGPMRVSR